MGLEPRTEALVLQGPPHVLSDNCDRGWPSAVGHLSEVWESSAQATGKEPKAQGRPPWSHTVGLKRGWDSRPGQSPPWPRGSVMERSPQREARGWSRYSSQAGGHPVSGSRRRASQTLGHEGGAESLPAPTQVLDRG